jgi:hypothetical protein
MIKTYKNFLNEQDQLEIEKKITSPSWLFGASSKKVSKNQHFFWQILNLEKDEFYSTHLLNQIKEVTGDDFDVERIYMNGHTACSQGNIHIDSEFEHGRTFLIYCNKSWDTENGGGTTFINEGQVTTYFPYPYSAIYFQNNIHHFASPLGRSFEGLRVTLAFKLFLK